MSKLSKEIKEYISCPQINGKSYGRWGALNVHQKINVWNLAEQCEMFEEIADKSMKELTKYKRAFEILEEKGVCVRNDRLYFDYEIYIKSTKEERELLDELLKS